MNSFDELTILENDIEKCVVKNDSQSFDKRYI